MGSAGVRWFGENTICAHSGAGKTTLLATLARLTQPSCGSICLNGVELSKGVMSKIASFVPQFDPMPRILTVSEYVMFSCALKLDRTTTSQEKEFLIQTVIENLSLTDCKDVLISKISGGERKRVSIASEIITRPRLLFLDEPTTGLDSSAAFRVIQSIRTAARDSIVLCSIHQPGVSLYNLFTGVVFLTEGKTAFFGSLNEARVFFNSQGYRCPHGFDEAEYYINIISNHRPHLNNSDNFETNLQKICDAYAQSSFSDFSAKIEENSRGFDIKDHTKGPGWFTQFNWLVWRICLEKRRTMLNGLIAFQYYALSLVVIGITYLGIDTERQSGVKDVMGMLYMTGTELVYSSAYTVLENLQRDIPIYLRERKYYGPTAYYVAVVLSWIPRLLLNSLFLTLLLTFLLKSTDNPFTTFLEYFLVTTACSIAAASYGVMISAFVESTDLAMSIMAPIELVAMIVAGVYYNMRTLTWLTRIFKYLSIFHYSHELLSIIHWRDVGTIECDVEGLPCFKSGAEVLEEYGYGEDNFGGILAELVGLTCVLYLLGMVGTIRRRIVKSMY